MNGGGTVLPFRRRLGPDEQKLVEDPDFRMSVAELAGYYVGRVRGAISLEDFFQAGMEGGARATLRYDPEKGSFKTYAWFDVRAGMTRLIAEGVRAKKAADAGAGRFLEEVADDALPEDSDEAHRGRLREFSDGLFGSMALGIYSEAARTAAAMGGMDAARDEARVFDAMDQALAALPEAQRALLRHVDVEGGTLKAWVGQPGCSSYITARRAYTRAKAELRDELARRGVTALPGARDVEEHAAGVRRGALGAKGSETA